MHILVDQELTSSPPLLAQSDLRLVLTPADSSPELPLSVLLGAQPTGAAHDEPHAA